MHHGYGGGRTRDQCFAGTDPEEDSLQDRGKRAGNPGIPEYRTGDEKQEDSTACVQRFLEYLQYRQVEKTEKINYNL